MNITLDHLPTRKRDQLQTAVEIIREQLQPDLIILFGSYARGDWVEVPEPGTPFYRYQSDFDLMLVVRNDHEVRRMRRKESIRKVLRGQVGTPVSLIYEDIHHVNACLAKARYFYVDIYKEGIVLHDNGKLKLDKPKELTSAERRVLAQEALEQYMTRADEFFVTYEVMRDRSAYATAAFLLHQACERLYCCILLVYTHYKPRTHDLEDLGDMVHAIDPRYLPVFPTGQPEEVRRFELLRDAYVDGRYDANYRITAEELAWLAERVQLLRALAEQHCPETIAGFVDRAE
ncbi:HEPN domain-containing protein [Chitinimonas koreensis]|uniref:HEPN domain-containing protein n=1 Tax=Chitinimonas koreensis TaxID=356302 RepID=UPI0003FFD447|nr:HEPN domain-containing protein [Chitinimonas koreensis]QNM95096.1 HEPN domain-containing protein [Chitinimonas koreensis]